MAVYTYDPSTDKLNLVAGATLYADTPIGVIQAFDAEEVPDGWLIFNGQTVNRADYPDLWARANRNGQVGVGKFYGIGDGSTTFTLADLRETSLKGYGETSRSVGAHVKSGGLGIGEFLDDRLQSHKHGQAIYSTSNTVGGPYPCLLPGPSVSDRYEYSMIGDRQGATTEVKAVGVVWAVKARMTGLPIDFAQQAEKISVDTVNTNLGRDLILDYQAQKTFRYGTKVVKTYQEATPNGSLMSISDVLTLFGITSGYYSFKISIVDRSNSTNLYSEYIVARNSTGGFSVKIIDDPNNVGRYIRPSDPTATTITLTGNQSTHAVMVTFEPFAYY